MIVSLDTPTPVVVSTDMGNAEYHGEREHISRSSAHRYRGVYGGRAQRYAEQYGKSLFAGNSATSFGTLVDGACEAVMAGADWRSRIAVPPSSVLASDGSRRGKAYQEWRSTLPVGGMECSLADFEKIGEIVDSILEHKAARALIESAVHSQYSVFWTDSHGHKRKARADGVTQNEWFDLKTTSSEWRELKWSFLRFGYDWQAVWYSEAARLSGFDGFEAKNFKFIVAQVFAPFDVKVVTLGEDALARAEIEITETLDEIRRRRETGSYVSDDYHAVQELVF